MLDKMENHLAAARAPAPTPAPNRRLVERALALAVRADWVGQTMCGVVTQVLDGDASKPFNLQLTCPGAMTCGGNTESSYAGCCVNDENCDFVTTCWDRTQYLASSDLLNVEPPPRVGYCTDQSAQYCLEVRYTNGLNTFACYTDHGAIGEATDGFVAAASTPIAGVSNSPGAVNHGAAQPTTPTTTPTAVPPSGGPALSTGAVVAIALVGAVVILGVLVFVFFYRRSVQKKAQAQLQETSILRNELAQQRMSQAPSHSNATSSWVGTQKLPTATVSEYGYSGEAPYPGSPGTNHSANPAMYYDNEGTVAGTVDHNPAPRI